MQKKAQEEQGAKETGKRASRMSLYGAVDVYKRQDLYSAAARQVIPFARSWVMASGMAPASITGMRTAAPMEARRAVSYTHLCCACRASGM